MIEPRYVWFPPRARSLGQDCIEFWQSCGGVLFDWQQFVIDGFLGLNEDGLFVSRDDGLAVARQNGKGVILQALEVFFAFELGIRNGYKMILHTAHQFATASDHQGRLEQFIKDCPDLHSKVRDKGGYKHANGDESINLKDGTVIRFKARMGGSGRGYSADFLAWDEAMEIPDAVIGAQKPMLRASQACYGPKIVYAGSAVDENTHKYGVPFSFLRERGIAKADKVAWAEWSAPFDHPDQMTFDLLRDRTLYPLGNPSMKDGLISEQTMADEIAGMPGRQAAVELENVGAWPRTDGGVDRKIDLGAFDALVNINSKLQPPYTLTFDVSPERWLAVALSGRNQDGKMHTEIHEHRQGTQWFVPWLGELYERSGHDIYTIAGDGIGPAASLRVELEEAGLPVEWITSSQLGEMCGYFVDLIAEGDLVHLGSVELRDAVAGAADRPLNDRWAWKRTSSDVDISPLVAATIGVGIAAGVGLGEVAIF